MQEIFYIIPAAVFTHAFPSPMDWLSLNTLDLIMAVINSLFKQCSPKPPAKQMNCLLPCLHFQKIHYLK